MNCKVQFLPVHEFDLISDFLANWVRVTRGCKKGVYIHRRGLLPPSASHGRGHLSMQGQDIRAAAAAGPAGVPGRQGAPAGRARYQGDGSAVAEQDSFITPLSSALELELGKAGA